MKKIILAGCLSAILLSSCSPIMMVAFGIKKPKKETNESVLSFVQKNDLDYDYIIRPASDSTYKTVLRTISDGQMNGIRIFSSNGDLLINTNDTSCHLRVRSTLTHALRTGQLPRATDGANIRQVVQSGTRCLNCPEGQTLFSQPLKPYVVVFGVAKFIPLKEKFTDIDYVRELKAAGLRDSVTVVLLSTDKMPKG